MTLLLQQLQPLLLRGRADSPPLLQGQLQQPWLQPALRFAA